MTTTIFERTSLGRSLLSRRGLILGMAGAGLGISYLTLVPAGLPADEPAHWSNVLFYGTHHWLPTVGAPGVTYEGQQGPVAYVLAALIQGLVHVLTGSLEASFYAARAIGGIEMAVAAMFAWRLLQRLVAPSTGRQVAMAYLVLCPMFLAMALSVQNDSLVLLLTFAAMEYALRHEGLSEPLKTGMVSGLLGGLAMLTKLTAWPLLLSVPAWMVMRHRSQTALRAIAAYAVGYAAVCGWWFVRNLVDYHSVLSAAAFNGKTNQFPPIGFHGVQTVFHVTENVVTYLWVPTEYFRELIHAPTALKAFIVALTVLLAALFALRIGKRGQDIHLDSSRSSAWVLVATTGVLGIVGWAVTNVWFTAIAPRMGYAALPMWLAIIAMAVDLVLLRIPAALRAVAVPVTCTFLLALNAWVLWATAMLPSEPFLIAFHHG